MRCFFLYFCLVFSCSGLTQVAAQNFSTPASGIDVIGQNQSRRIQAGDTLYQLSQRYDISVPELLRANPKIEPRRLQVGQKLNLPTRYILPPGDRQGIVINLAELRLYYYAPNGRQILTFPIGIGRQGRSTPLLSTKIIERREKPTWYVPVSIREEAERKGKPLPASVPPGPDNPLGEYALRLLPRDYLIHGTNAPTSVGTRASAGCIRLYPQDIKQLFHAVDLNTTVRIINQPYKLGWINRTLFLQVFPAFSDYRTKTPSVNAFREDLEQAEKTHRLRIDWNRVNTMLASRDGVALPIGTLEG